MNVTGWVTGGGGFLSVADGQTGRRVAFQTCHVEIHAVSTEMEKSGDSNHSVKQY